MPLSRSSFELQSSDLSAIAMAEAEASAKEDQTFTAFHAVEP
jgi:hypothetical protein